MAKKILIVDDNYDNLEMLEIVLKSERFEVVSALNGQEALEKLKSQTFDLIISDILMPVMDGFMFCKACKRDQYLKNISFVFYTATYIDSKDEEFALSLGAKKFLRKPMEPSQILKVIREVMASDNTGVIAQPPSKQDETELFKLYSERLVVKLEKKNLDLEKEIASHKITEIKLIESEKRFRHIFEHSAVGKTLISPEGNFILVNSSFANLLGYEISELQTLSFIDITYPEDIEKSKACMQWLLSGKTDKDRLEKRYLHKNGTVIWTDISMFLFRNEIGVPLFVISDIVDITYKKQKETELIKAKEKAEESDRLKTAFLHNISHEIRTPLNGIVGFSELMSEAAIANAQLKLYSDIIGQSSEKLLSVVNDIINIATIEAGIEQTTKSETTIFKIVDFIKKHFIEKAKSKNLSFEVKNCPEEKISFITDEAKLQAILSCLVDNAIKFTNQGFVRLTCNMVSNKLEFKVEDSGIGIPLDFHDKVFESFFQIFNSDTHFYGGTGLGLAIVKSYVHFLNGEIKLTSSANSGTTFIVSIPVDYPSKPLLAEIIEVGGQEKQEALSILIAEDEPANFQLIKHFFKNSGLRILHAENGINAVTICKENPDIGLVLMDIKMPVMDGYEAASLIKKFRPDLPIIAQSAYIYKDERAKEMSVYMDGFLEKPLTKTSVFNKVKKHLQL